MAKKTSQQNNAFIAVEELNYESAFEEFNSVVEKLETEELSLEEAMAYFERGQNLAHYCARLLDQTELKVEQIIGDEVVDFEFNVD